MTREEAIEVYHELLNQKIKEAFEVFAPELKESEDERIRKVLVSIVKWLGFDSSFFTDNSVTKNEVLAYLEKQKINTEGDFGRGYDCGYKACLNSHGAEFFEKQKEQKPAEWSEDIIRKGIKEVGLTQYQIDWLKNNVFPPKEEQKPGTKLTRWVARDENGEIYAFEDYPEKDSEMWIGSNSMLLDRKSFPDLKWEVEITIRKK